MILSKGILLDVTVLIIRLQSTEEALGIGKSASRAGFVGGTGHGLPASTRMAIALCNLLRCFLDCFMKKGINNGRKGQSLCRSSTASFIQGYPDVILQCLVMLYVGQEAVPATRYGPLIRHPITGGGVTDHWCPALCEVVEPILLGAVTETGCSSHAYPSLQRFLNHCDGASHLLENPDGDEYPCTFFDALEGGDLMDSDEVGDKPSVTAGAGSRVIRSFCFERGSVYFSELLGLGRALCSLHRASGGNLSTRSRLRSVSYLRTLMQETSTRTALGQRSTPGNLDGDSTRYQRAQLMVDFDAPSKFAVAIRDSDEGVRVCAAEVAIFALAAGVSWLNGLAVRDPRGLVALGFCSFAWTSGFVALIYSGGKEATLGLEALQLAASGGDAATAFWSEAGVISSLGWILNQPLSDEGHEQLAIQVVQELARHGSVGDGCGRDLVEAHPSLMKVMEAQGIALPAPPTVAGLQQTWEELQDFGYEGATLEEQSAAVRQMTSVICRMSADGSPFPRPVTGMMGHVWSWLRRTMEQLSTDSSGHPLTLERDSFVRDVLYLASIVADCLQHSPDAEILLLAPLSAHRTEIPKSDEEDFRGEYPPSDFTLAEADSGLELLIKCIGISAPVETTGHHLHPVHSLVPMIMDVIANIVASGRPNIVELAVKSGLGRFAAEAVQCAQQIIRQIHTRGSSMEAAYLCSVYPSARQARVKLISRLLSAGIAFQEQLIISGITKDVMGSMLANTGEVQVSSSRIPANFLPYNGTALSRGEALEIAHAIVRRMHDCPVLARELVGQAANEHILEGEQRRVQETRSRFILSSAIQVLHLMARTAIKFPEAERMLVHAGVPLLAIRASKASNLSAQASRLLSAWLLGASNGAPRTSTEGFRVDTQREDKEDPSMVTPLQEDFGAPKKMRSDTVVAFTLDAPAEGLSETHFLQRLRKCGVIPEEPGAQQTPVRIVSVLAMPAPCTVSIRVPLLIARSIWDYCLSGKLMDSLPRLLYVESEGLGKLLADGSDADIAGKAMKRSLDILGTDSVGIKTGSATWLGSAPLPEWQNESGEVLEGTMDISRVKGKQRNADIRQVLSRLGPCVVQVRRAFEKYEGWDVLSSLRELGIRSDMLEVAGKSPLAKGRASFPEFLQIYSQVTGLDASDKRDTGGDVGAQIWIDGKEGIWEPVPHAAASALRLVFDGQTVPFSGACDAELDLESSVPASSLVQMVQAVDPRVSPSEVEAYLQQRQSFVQGLFRGRVNFQEYLRAVRWLAGGEPWERRYQGGYTLRGNTADSRSEVSPDSDGEDPPKVRKTQQTTSKDRDHLTALRKAFSLYDADNDGLISLQDLQETFDKQGRDASIFELRGKVHGGWRKMTSFLSH